MARKHLARRLFHFFITLCFIFFLGPCPPFVCLFTQQYVIYDLFVSLIYFPISIRLFIDRSHFPLMLSANNN